MVKTALKPTSKSPPASATSKAKVDIPLKMTSKVASKLASPNAEQKAKSDVQVIQTDRPKRSCVCKIIGLQGNLAALYLEKAPGDDAFHQPIKIAMEAKLLANEGFIMLTNRRASSSTNDSMINTTNSYPRKIYIINLDENTPSARLSAMEAACRIMNSPTNNRYNIPYIIDDTSDITPPLFPKVDEWVLDRQVVDLILTLYNNVTSDWAKLYKDEAAYYFSGPPFCQTAIYKLGYCDTDNDVSSDSTIKEP
jgi:hypothetical protein